MEFFVDFILTQLFIMSLFLCSHINVTFKSWLDLNQEVWCGSSCTMVELYLCLSDYVRLLNLNGQVKTARRHSVVDMQFEFRIEALGNKFHNMCFA